MPRLASKTCLVTGAARGIGQAIAEHFAAEGAHVILTDIDLNRLSLTADRISQPYAQLDVSSEADWQKIGDLYPEVDVLVNNAGITGFEAGPVPHNPEHVGLEDWRAVHAVNLDGVFLGCRYAIGAMRNRPSGSIINISSRSGMVGIPLAAAYASSKAAVRNHTKSVALYCAQSGLNIRCNSIHPGAIVTPMWEPILGDGETREANMRKFTADTPLQRFGDPKEVAALAVMLASDECAFMTGSELTVDGGILAGSVVPPEPEQP